MPDQNQSKSASPTLPLEYPVGGSGHPSTPGVNGQAPKKDIPAIPAEYLGGQNKVSTIPVNTTPLPNVKPPQDISEISPKARQELENKAKTLIKDIDNGNPKSKSASGNPKKSNTGMVAGLGALALVLVGIGIFAGIKILGLPGSQEQRSQAGSCGSGCGNEPSGYSFNRPPSTIGPFSQGGKLVLYYTNLGGGVMTRKIKLIYKGSEQIVEVTAPDRERKVTSITVNAGETVSLASVEEVSVEALPDCAPNKSQPYNAWGWIAVNSDNTCGSGLPGPPSACTPFGKPSVTDHISWAAGMGDQIIAKQCWADTREWPGDYDFNDFFIQFGIEPAGLSIPTPTVGAGMTCSGLTLNPATPSFGSNVTLSCAGEPAATLPYADFQYKVGSGDYVGITNATNTTATLQVNRVGTYTVRCRMCTSQAKTTCTTWQTATP